MLFRPRSQNRPFHYGPFPLETLSRDDGILARETARPRRAPPPAAAPEDPLGRAALRYRELFARFRDGPVAPARAPVPDDLSRRAVDIKERPTSSTPPRSASAACPRPRGTRARNAGRTISRS